ncbi:phage tail protein [Bosea massiliensis]|uniref:Phage tail protein n=1 Tax=Bosea massiliensis TaxID=151419 RepID=A0ABW0P9C5_9HYPH
MARDPHLLPDNARPLEIALSLATALGPDIDEAVVELRGIKLRNPPPSYLPYLIYEYGLGELTPYLPNLYELIEDGIDWQRIRGTPAAVAQALGWIGYEGEIEDPSIRRWRWNLFQLALDRVRDDEIDLGRIEGVAQLSVPVRSYFWRGYHGYDVRNLEFGWKRWGDSIWGGYSGVRLPGGQAKWSYGRSYSVDHALTDDELEDLEVYLPPAGSEPLGWGAFPWPAAPWTDSAARARSVAMLEALDIGTAWVAFKDADGDVIGYRRARACHPVTQGASGTYTIGGTGFTPAASGATILYIEALTGFGDGYGHTAASVSFMVRGEPSSGYPPGALWLPPGALVSASPPLAETQVNIEFGRTVRERVSVALRF